MVDSDDKMIPTNAPITHDDHYMSRVREGVHKGCELGVLDLHACTVEHIDMLKGPIFDDSNNHQKQRWMKKKEKLTLELGLSVATAQFKLFHNIRYLFESVEVPMRAAALMSNNQKRGLLKQYYLIQ
jgi:hypothetical protein